LHKVLAKRISCRHLGRPNFYGEPIYCVARRRTAPPRTRQRSVHNSLGTKLVLLESKTKVTWLEYEFTIASQLNRLNTLNMSRVEERRSRERRAEPRYPINEFSVLRSTGDIAAVRVLDISAIGLRVTSVGPMPIGSEVEVRFGGVRVSGLVRNCCCLRAAEFQLGIVLASVCAAQNSVAGRLDHISILRRRKTSEGVGATGRSTG
jgi:hypothetical protein